MLEKSEPETEGPFLTTLNRVRGARESLDWDKVDRKTTKKEGIIHAPRHCG